MRGHRHLFAALLVLLWSVPIATALAGESGPGSYDPATVVATIDGIPVTLGDVLFRYARLPTASRRAYEALDHPLDAFLADLVANLVVIREAEAMELDADPLYVGLLALKREEALRDLYARRTLLAAIDEAALRRRYEEEKERFRIEPEALLHYLLVTPVEEHPCPNLEGDDAVGEEAARAKAERLRERLLAGEPFAALARSASEDASAADGGALGWVRLASLVDEVAAVAAAVPPGEPSAVFRSPLGYHVIVVERRRDGGTVPFDAVRELLFQELVAERGGELRRAVEGEREELLRRHVVRSFPDRLP